MCKNPQSSRVEEKEYFPTPCFAALGSQSLVGLCTNANGITALEHVKRHLTRHPNTNKHLQHQALPGEHDIYILNETTRRLERGSISDLLWDFFVHFKKGIDDGVQSYSPL